VRASLRASPRRRRSPPPALRRQVIKVGTSSLTRAERGTLNLTSLAAIVETVRDIREAGFHVVLVSSGAVGVGGQRLGLAARPAEMARKQALAAIGQVHLMRHYEDMFSAVGLTCAQVLLTADNLSCRGQYAAAAACFSALLQVRLRSPPHSPPVRIHSPTGG
jgi:glutamate 5-kinase